MANTAQHPSQSKAGTAQVPVKDDAVWAARRSGNIRLAWGMVGFAVLVFMLAVWKYRPL